MCRIRGFCQAVFSSKIRVVEMAGQGSHPFDKLCDIWLL
jgi:hypothetical protein